MLKNTLILLLSILTIVACNGGKSSADSATSTSDSAENATEEVSTSSSKSYVKWLNNYEDFIDNEYLPLMKKANSGDMSALSDMNSYMEKATKLGEEAMELQGELSGSDLDDYMVRYARILEKLSATM